ncbi:MAG: RNA polymerase sigma factor [Bacteroidetes bacterium]|uniref:RNA polymerase sigma factor n=1 Tax=Candidatus Caccoplasma merdipullorum TaxID=2840718 RepID=A0A9D9E3Y7_9BACT|nr:RNA polymerase sigma factor [Candidatus Caccoplasma merdipullorum]
MSVKEDLLDNKLLNIKDNMLGFAYSLTNNEEEAMDLFQDTALKVLDSRDKYIDKSNFAGWVFTIMRNIFINNYRRSLRNKVVLEDDDNCYSLPYINNTTDNSCDIHTLNDINIVLKSFSKDYSVPLSMFIIGYKYVEIAECMNMPIGTVKSRIHIARCKLQKALEDYK